MIEGRDLGHHAKQEREGCGKRIEVVAGKVDRSEKESHGAAAVPERSGGSCCSARTEVCTPHGLTLSGLARRICVRVVPTFLLGVVRVFHTIRNAGSALEN